MVFSSITFLFAFLAAVLLLYFVCPLKGKNWLLALSGLVFYAWGEPVYLFLMIAAAAVNWGFGLLIEKRHKRVFLVLALVLDLGCLAVFKYTGFVVENLNALFGASIPVPAIALPIGISFYTFQALSYTVDVWRGDVPAQRSFAEFLLYISLFPQLIAGPIVRYADVAGQIDARSFDAADAFYGATRFCIGLAKKVLLADAAGKVAAQILGGSAASATTAAAWLGIVLYTFEIYFDFSGYSDMAIGLGRMLGFRFPENFRYPYLCSSISDFWRRWHISLGSWFKEYLYFPLGGSRTGTLRTLRNLLLVWLATGLWHGASWNYVLWGLYFGVLICLEKLLAPRFRAHPRKGLLAGLYRPVCLLLAVLGWVLFRAEDLPAAGRYFACLFGGAAGASAQARLYLHDFWPVLLLGAVGATPLCAKLAGRLGAKLRPGVRAAVQAVLVLALLACSTVWLLNGSFQSFVYFQF